MNDAKRNSGLDGAKSLMSALLRQPPKLHDEMKVGKAKKDGGKPGNRKPKKESTSNSEGR